MVRRPRCDMGVIPEPVVVLGGGGFIGSQLAARLGDDGAAVTAVDVSFPTIRERWWSAVPRRILSMESPECAAEAVRGARTVFHLAADMGGVGYFHSDADLAAAMTNGRMTLNVLRACMGARVERVVYASSACVYPVERSGETLHEPDIGRGTPDALYGAEKLQGLRLCAKVPGARVAVLDTQFGPGSEWLGRRAKFPAAVAAKAIKARTTGQLALWGDGRQLRRFLHVTDTVDRLLTVAGAEHYAGPVNVVGAPIESCRAVAERCLRLAGAEGAEIVTEPGPTGVAARIVSGDKFADTYGQPSELPIEEGFRRLIGWLDEVME